MASKLIYQIKCDACGKMEHIDGLFIGRSAWQADNFNKIIRDVLK